jgi:hypothetical protein
MAVVGAPAPLTASDDAWQLEGSNVLRYQSMDLTTDAQNHRMSGCSFNTRR